MKDKLEAQIEICKTIIHNRNLPGESRGKGSIIVLSFLGELGNFIVILTVRKMIGCVHGTDFIMFLM